jgi:coenzyme PQQ precursor peptide PqqA
LSTIFAEFRSKENRCNHHAKGPDARQIRPRTPVAYHEIGSSYKWLVPGGSGWYVRERDRRTGPRSEAGEEDMRRTTPVIVETCIGMEVTSYASAAI